MINLNSNFQFDIELYKDKVRLILYKDGTEIACRKERFSHLFQFLELFDGDLFKGRIRLSKRENHIEVYFKKDCMGIIDCNLFFKEIDNLRTKKNKSTLKIKR